MQDIARGSFYLGRTQSIEGRGQEQPLLYRANNLTTHGVIVGMTGSGKTGLGIIALEEALLSDIPVLVIDPKGDMGNLFLNFPGLEAKDFRPWIDEGEARRKGVDPETYAAQVATTWSKGLASWGVTPKRMQQLRSGAECEVYTPGSTVGTPVNVLGSLRAPHVSWETASEYLAEEIENLVSGILLMADIDADPMISREHILLSNLIEHAWRKGTDLDLASLIGHIQAPPMRKLGVFDLDAFFPVDDRRELALRLNGLLASSAFKSWAQGAPLEIGPMLRSTDGRPKATVVYLQHLSDTERQFVVTLLLSKLVTWIRRQPGSSELRALVYMDEVFGFVPPTAKPPSKKPILTILKQARAHGIGMLLSTQNPVDLDYKAMSNAGTWMIGRLQTERDKARILEGLESSSGSVDMGRLDRLIGALEKRQFILHTTRSPAPTVFTTRWAMSYLRGPLTLKEISTLSGDYAQETYEQRPAEDITLASDETTIPPEVAQGVPVYYLDEGAPWGDKIRAQHGGSRVEPGIVARVQLRFDDRYAKVDHVDEWEAVYFPIDDHFTPENGIAVDYDPRDLSESLAGDTRYALTDAPIAEKSYFADVEGEIKEWLYHNRDIEVFKNSTLKKYSRVGESKEDFILRCEETAEQRADEEASKLRERYEAKVRRLHDRLERAESRVREREAAVSGRKQQEVLSGVGDLLSMFMKGKMRSTSLSKAASRRSQTVRAQERLRTAQQQAESVHEEIEQVEDDLADELIAISEHWDAATKDIEIVEIALEKSDINIQEIGLLWVPTGAVDQGKE